jgi:hypothetical protein
LGESVNRRHLWRRSSLRTQPKEYGPGKAGPQRDFVRRLCVTLFHRWRPGRIFVILTSYYDEAGTHGGSPVTVMAGVMATANQWHRFETTAARLKRNYGFTVFHSKEFKNRSGAFRGWSIQKQLSLISELGEAANEKNIMEGVMFVLSNREYEESYKGSVRYFRQDSKYGLCFRNCLLHLILDAADRLGTHKKFSETRLNVVLESGAKGADDAKRIFDETRQETERIGLNLLGTLTFASKGDPDSDALWLPDFLAHVTFMRGDSERTQPSALYTENRLMRDKGGLTLLRFREGGLADVKRQLIERVRAKRLAKRNRGPSSAPGARAG